MLTVSLPGLVRLYGFRGASAAALVLAIPGAALAAPVPVEPDRWVLDGEATIAERDGRRAIHIGPGPGKPLKGGQATVRGLDFSTGRIEFDMLIDGERDFAGPLFRASADGNAELFYIRPHMNARPDSTQYTPVTFGNLGWQIFSGPGYNSNVEFNLGKWMHVRLDVYPGSMLVTVDGKPALSVPHLKGANRSGELGFTGVGSAWFANLEVEPIAGYADPAPAAPEPSLPAGSVTRWQVSAPLAAAAAFERAAQRDWAGLSWKALSSESNGITNLTLAGPDQPQADSYIAKFTLRSPGKCRARMEFGFSDRVRIFVNGVPHYEGADLQASRDYRFLGIVGFWDSLFLPLKPGANEVAFVVSDNTNGGTAAAARFDPADGLTIE